MLSCHICCINATALNNNISNDINNNNFETTTRVLHKSTANL